MAVVVPKQATAPTAPAWRDPIMKAVMEAAVPQTSVQQPCTVQPVPTSSFTSAP